MIDIYDVVKKLTGNINPIGETNIDNERFENLKNVCGLVDILLSEIDTVATGNKNQSEFSRKRAGEFASKFFDKIGIKE